MHPGARAAARIHEVAPLTLRVEPCEEAECPERFGSLQGRQLPDAIQLANPPAGDVQVRSDGWFEGAPQRFEREISARLLSTDETVRSTETNEAPQLFATPRTILERETGLEPATPSLGSSCSTN